MSENRVKKKKFDGTEVEVLDATYEEGTPEGPDKWRKKMQSRSDMLDYLKTSLRYYYEDNVYGSEKRKTPA